MVDLGFFVSRVALWGSLLFTSSAAAWVVQPCIFMIHLFIIVLCSEKYCSRFSAISLTTITAKVITFSAHKHTLIFTISENVMTGLEFLKMVFDGAALAWEIFEIEQSLDAMAANFGSKRPTSLMF